MVSSPLPAAAKADKPEDAAPKRISASGNGRRRPTAFWKARQELEELEQLSAHPTPKAKIRRPTRVEMEVRIRTVAAMWVHGESRRAMAAAVLPDAPDWKQINVFCLRHKRDLTAEAARLRQTEKNVEATLRQA